MSLDGDLSEELTENPRHADPPVHSDSYPTEAVVVALMRPRRVCALASIVGDDIANFLKEGALL